MKKDRTILDKEGNRQYRIEGLKRAVFSDLYHHFLSKNWITVLLIIFSSSMVVNMIFTSFYITCGGINNANHWYDYFFFSIQTLSTIGYGYMYPTNICSHILVATQSFLGMLFVSFLTGIVFSKFAIPRAKISYTKNAVVSMEGEDLLFKFRMANMRGNQIVDAYVKVVLLKLEKLSDGTNFRKMYDMDLMRDRIPMFSLSFTVKHRIDEYSPFYGETHQSLMEKQSMVIITINGVDETVSQSVVSKYIYSFEEIKWGMKFSDVFIYDNQGQIYFDFNHFNNLIEEIV